MRRCMQNKCTFNKVAGCQRCEECNCTSNWVEDTCEHCRKCEGKSGELRWNSESSGDVIQLKEKKKRKEIMVEC